MAMTLGEATVDENGNVTKSGVIGRCYDAIYAQTAAAIPGGFPSGATGTTFKRAIAGQAIAQGTALFNVLVNDAQAAIRTSDSALQRTPNPNGPNAPTQGPETTKYLSIV